MTHRQTVWVIGANSFTGNYLVPALKENNYQVDTTRVDIRNAQQIEQEMLRIQPEYVINLAAISFVPDGENTDIYAINTLGPQNILDACLKMAQVPKKIILPSTSHVYGQQTREIIDENCPIDPINHYSCSKWAMEQIAKTYQQELNITITRPFNYTGKGQAEKFLIPKIVQHFKQKSKVITLGNINIWRDFSDVRWVVKAYIALLTEETLFQIFNLCSGHMMSIKEIIDHLHAVTGHEIKIETNAAFIRKTDIQRQRGSQQVLLNTCPQLTLPMDFKQTLSWMLTD